MQNIKHGRVHPISFVRFQDGNMALLHLCAKKNAYKNPFIPHST